MRARRWSAAIGCSMLLVFTACEGDERGRSDTGNDLGDLVDLGDDFASDGSPQSTIDFESVERGTGISTVNCSCINVNIEPGLVGITDYLTGETLAETTFPLFITDEDPTAVYIWSATLVNNSVTCYDVIIGVEVATSPRWLAVHNFIPVAWQGYPEAPDRPSYADFTACGVRGSISVTQVESADQTARGTYTEDDCIATIDAAYDLAVVENQTVTVDLVIDPHPGGTAENPWDNPTLGSAMPAGTLEGVLNGSATIISTLDYLETIHEDIAVECSDPADNRDFDYDGVWALEDAERQDDVNQGSLGLYAYFLTEGQLVLALWDGDDVIRFNVEGTILTDAPASPSPGQSYELDIHHSMDTLFNERGALDDDGIAFVGVPSTSYDIVARPPQMSGYAIAAGLLVPGFTKSVESSVEMRLERYLPLSR